MSCGDRGKFARPADHPNGYHPRMRSIRFLGVAVVALVGAQQPPQPPDTILLNGHVVTVDPRFSIVQAVAIRGGRFVAVGSDTDIRKLAGSSTRVIDVHGQTVIPGLADGHLHDAGGGPGVDLSRTRSIDDVLRAIADRVKQRQAGDVIVTNSDWHEAQLKEHRLVYRKDLDT